MDLISQSFLGALAEGIVIQTAEGDITLCNPAAERILGLTKEQMLGKTSIDPSWRSIHEDGSLFPGDTHPSMVTLRTGQALRNVIMGVHKPDGTLTWISINSEPIFENSTKKPTAVVASFVDITEIKQTSLRFQAIFNSMYQFIGLMEPDGTLIEANRTALEFAGIRAEEVIGKKFWDTYWWSTTTETRQKLQESVQRAARGEFIRYDVEVRGGGDSLVMIDFSIKPVFNEKQEVVMLIPEGRDISDQKKMERLLQETNQTLERKAQALETSNKELEHFAYVASHDLQEPLRTITNFMQLLVRKYETHLPDEALQYVTRVANAASRMKTLILDLLEYARIGQHADALEWVDCNDLVRTVIANAEGYSKETNGEIRFSDLPTIRSFRPLLMQLFQNLIGNGLKYNKSQTPQVEISCSEMLSEWKFCVKDNGIGIDPEFNEKIFIIFQRLHSREEFSGTGIGLSICRKIVEQHEGRIWVESAPGQGSAFFFTISKHL
jgi:PAS domain S-box-containing protein